MKYQVNTICGLVSQDDVIEIDPPKLVQILNKYLGNEVCDFVYNESPEDERYISQIEIWVTDGSMTDAEMNIIADAASYLGQNWTAKRKQFEGSVTQPAGVLN